MRNTVNVLAEINAQLLDIGKGKVAVEVKGQDNEQILDVLLSLVEAVLEETGETADNLCRALVGKSIEDMIEEDTNNGLLDEMYDDEDDDEYDDDDEEYDKFKERMNKLTKDMKKDGIEMEICPLNGSEGDEDFIKGMELLSKAFEKRRK